MQEEETGETEVAETKKALGLDPAPRRVAVVRDEATATTLFALDRVIGGHASITWLVRGAMTAAHAACLVAGLRHDLTGSASRPN